MLVQVEAAGVCGHDVLQGAARLPGRDDDVILGHEIAGRVVDVGEDADPALRGRAVVVLQRLSCGRCRACEEGRPDLCAASSLLGHDRDGGYAELVAVPERAVIPLPPDVPWEHAALLACPLGTSLRALLTVGGLRPGARVLVTGAGGGLGAQQVQIASALGAEVVAATRDASKAAALLELGAAHVAIAADGRFAADVWGWSGRVGVDLAVDNVGPTLPETLRCMAPGGRIVLLGNVDVSDATVSLGRIIARRITITGSGSPTREDVRQALALVRSGRVLPAVAEVLPFSRAADAHRHMTEGSALGRIVLRGW